MGLFDLFKKSDGSVSKTKSVAAGGSGVVGLAMLIAVPFITDHEGESLKAYQDVVGVYTICNGETLGVKPGQTATKDQCKALTESRTYQFMSHVSLLIRVPIPPATLAAHTSFAYNIGVSGYSTSQALKLTNTGDLKGGCMAMMNWYTAGGKDCRVKSNGCYGLINRRSDEVKLCLKDIK